ncbi:MULTISPECIES: hypothetical protein [Halorubrum]|jgi:hypothetical protein|uniref:DUF8081 domain-containing protein n=1 Tax=Halorubrum ezzemoulense TaxID=337243 RepID=A0A256J378_HALEZ|nr:MULTISPECIES: hypothetical protein [Halorubrum]OYR80480.1 hypothetical protein DJ71_14770 [Halorubrum sp. E3]OYR81757.1 hypothetical protein DJ72_10435 [Halorubrum distributum]OYR63225.1 hypothetical protein DJ83_03210 [Halorubrum ezzemoulense]OYR68828.1 hypothetical protein DJ78_12545 [Halorubrum ezzemoulense]OYR81868.1 hypothetical protein DJ84_11955 [Halorubrum ezzemoulense]
MVDYIVEIKDSVFRETPLAEANFDEDGRLAFDLKADAEEWVTEQNREHTSRGQLTLHTAHPTDTSDVDAYAVFQPVKGVWVPDS